MKTEVWRCIDAEYQNKGMVRILYRACGCAEGFFDAPESTEENPVLVPFTYGEAVDMEVETLDFSAGDMSVDAGEGYLIKSAIIKKPETLVPENIAKDVEIAGIRGTHTGGGESNLLTDYLIGNLSYIADSNVTVLPSYIFHHNNVTEVSFPNCVNVGSYAFYQCGSLSSAYLPSCSVLNPGAFASCTRLPYIDLPLITSVPYSAFYYCTSLSSIGLTDANIKNVGTDAFRGCTKISSISWPACTEVGIRAFLGCTSLATVDLSAVVNVYASAFQGCTALTDVSFPACSSVGAYAFSGCTNLQTVYLPMCSFIGTSVFSGCTNLSSVTLGKVKGIAAYVFSGKSNLVYVSLPSCNSIANYAFSGCHKLQYVHLGNYPSVYSYVFSNACSGQYLRLTGNARWYSYALRYCQASRISFTAGGTFYNYMCAYNYSVRDMYFGGSPYSYCFVGCSNLERAQINTVFGGYVGIQAFGYCRKLKAIKTGPVSYISQYAFNTCEALSVIYITGSYAGISSMSINANVFSSSPIVDSTYLGYYGSIYVPESLVTFFQTMPGLSTYADRITAVTDEIKALFEGDLE